MDTQQKSKLKASIEKEFQAIEAKYQKINKILEPINELMDKSLFKEAMQSWQNEGRKGNEPQLSQFVGAWQRSLQAAQNSVNVAVIEFEANVRTNLEKFEL